MVTFNSDLTTAGEFVELQVGKIGIISVYLTHIVGLHSVFYN